ncbi:MAG: hypothetical protein AAB263_18050, partial [Planctomycetota bacterium]
MQAVVIATLCDSTQPIDILEDARSYVVGSDYYGTTDMEKAGVARPAFWSVACQIKGGVTGLTEGNKLLWNTREDGGSGVSPVKLQNPIGFMKPSTGTGTNCPGDQGFPGDPGFRKNNYIRTILLRGYSVSVTVWNCTGFTYTWTRSGVGSVAASMNEPDPASDAVLRATDIGTSDIEPDKFASTFPLNVPSADMNLDGVTNAADTLAAYDASGLTAAPAALLTFGVPVNVRMYQDLQRAQFPSGHPLFNDCNPDAGVSYGNVTAAVYDGFGNATSGGILDARNNANLEKCMPSLTGNEIRSIAARGGAIRSSTDMQYETTFGGAVFATLSAMAKGATSNSIMFCRYANGLGVQAQFNAIMLGYPCDPTGDGSIDTLVPEVAASVVMLNEGSGDVEKCLNDFNDGTNKTSQNTTEAGGGCTYAAGDCK